MDAEDAKNIQHQILQSYIDSIRPLVDNESIEFGKDYKLDVRHRLVQRVTFCFKSREKATLKMFTKRNVPPFRIEIDNVHNFFHVNTNHPDHLITRVCIPENLFNMRHIMTTGSGACGYYEPERKKLWELIKAHFDCEILT